MSGRRRRAPISPSSSPEALLFDPDPGAYLPHRYPFLFLDRIVSLEPGVGAVAVTRITGPEFFPPTLCIEMMAQLGGIAAADSDRGGGGILAAIDRAEILAFPSAGESLTTSVKVVKSFGPLHLVEGEVFCAEKLVARATVTLRVGTLT